jgi:hypothetical protein
MSYSKTPRMREVAKRKAREAAKEMRENRRLIKKMRAIGTSNYAIAIALGIPEDSPLLSES